MAIASKGALMTGTTGWSHTTSAASYTGTTATTAVSVGDIALVMLAADNTSTTDGDNSELTGVTDTGGNTWRKLGEYTNSPGGAAADGVTVSCWYTKATTALATGSTITFTYGSARVGKAGIGWVFTIGSGNVVKQTTSAAVQTQEVTGASNGFGSSSFASLPSLARLYLRVCGKEASSTGFLTASTNFTQMNVRGTGTAMLVRAEYRLNTSTGETSNPTYNVTGDTASLFFALEEVADVVNSNGTLASTLDPLTAAATATSTISGTSAKTLDALTSVATATSTISGLGAAILAALTSVATGAVPGIGTGAATLEAATLAAAGIVSTLVTGTGAVTLADLTGAGAGAAAVAGTASRTLDALTVVATGGAPPLTGTTTVTLAVLTSVGTGTSPITGTSTAILAALTLTATGTSVAVALGSAAITFDALTSTGTATSTVTGTLAKTLGALTLVAGQGIQFASSSEGQGIGSPLTIAALDVQAGNAQIVIIGKRPSSATVASVTDTAGNTYTLQKRHINTTSLSLAVEMWTSQVPCLGHASNVVTVTFTGSPDKVGALLAQYRGVKAIGGGNSGSTATTGGAGSQPSTDIAVAAHSSYALMGAFMSGEPTVAAGGFGTALRDTSQTTGGVTSGNHVTILSDNTNADSVINSVVGSPSGHWVGVSIELIQGVSTAGSLAKTLDTLTAAATGTAAGGGSLAQTLAALTVAAVAASTISGAAAPALGVLTVTATGTTGPVPLTGTATITLGTLTAVSTATSTIRGSSAVTVGVVTLAGAASSTIRGAGAATLGTLTLSGFGGAGAQGVVAVTLAPLTAAATGSVSNVIQGALAATLGTLTATGQGSVAFPAFGDLAVQLAPLVAAAAGSVTNPTRPPTGGRLLGGRHSIAVGPHPVTMIPVGPHHTRGRIPVGPSRSPFPLTARRGIPVGPGRHRGGLH